VKNQKYFMSQSGNFVCELLEATTVNLEIYLRRETIGLKQSLGSWFVSIG